ncbi:MAG: KamA family radical SAM protein [Desulfosarcina sp.]|nr:KamA family radical SAM protein [Desulfosarcina sp.]MBC2742196.1 KamA family radical SAM protein [Desulfosarcina sp.]MBC2765108.1 KamA family radical SAM protein [Desulfosarcina sp.]
MDMFTREILDELAVPVGGKPEPVLAKEIRLGFEQAVAGNKTRPILEFFARLTELSRERGIGPQDLGLTKDELEKLAAKHEEIDEHGVTLGGRLGQARPIVQTANDRVAEYIAKKDQEAPSGIQLWERVLENQARIMAALGMSKTDWPSYEGQLRHRIDDVATLAKCIELPAGAIAEVTRVTKNYRMRLTPYYASLIMPGEVNDPVLLQSVPTAEMVDNQGVELPPVASDHSPARLVDQFYPRVLTIKATNMCAMYCTHCLRIAHIGKHDQVYGKEAYSEALEYIRGNDLIRDVLITGGDAFALPNKHLAWLLAELDSIDHVKVKRLGTRIPVTAPMRVDEELLDILEASDERGPVRVVTQINTAQEITPTSATAFRKISRRVTAVMNQAVLLRGINDNRIKMWKLCETIQEAHVRPYYVFNCSYRNPQYAHMRVPLSVGQDIIESMYGNISGDAIPRYIATAGGKVPLHRSNVVKVENGMITLKKPWSGEEAVYPDADSKLYGHDEDFAFMRHAG